MMHRILLKCRSYMKIIALEKNAVRWYNIKKIILKWG